MLALVRLLLLVTVVIAQDVERLRRMLARAGIKSVFANDTGYIDASEVFNKRYSAFKPIVVTYPTSPQQVSVVVKAGAAQGLQVNTRSGGHGYAANDVGGKDGVVLIDTSRMNRVKYNAKTKRATVETGTKLGDLALALNEYGRAIPHGRCSHVGVGGHAGHGGYGFVSRLWGLTLDVIHSATVVLADGTIRVASKTSNPELFWALRGAASSFGVVTSIEVETLPVDGDFRVTITKYNWAALPHLAAAEALIAWQDFTSRDDLPLQFGGEMFFLKGPVEGTIAAQFTGASFGGSEAAANATIQQFINSFDYTQADQIRHSNGNWIDALQSVTSGRLNTSTDTNVRNPAAFYAKSLSTLEDSPMSNESIHAAMEYMGVEAFSVAGIHVLEVELWGGKGSLINKVPNWATSFGQRDTHFGMQLQYISGPPPFSDRGFGILDGMVEKIVANNRPNWEYGSYLNYIDDRLKNWQEQYFGHHYPQLQVLKKQFDPRNTFRGPLAVELP